MATIEERLALYRKNRTEKFDKLKEDKATQRNEKSNSQAAQSTEDTSDNVSIQLEYFFLKHMNNIFFPFFISEYGYRKSYRKHSHIDPRFIKQTNRQFFVIFGENETRLYH